MPYQPQRPETTRRTQISDPSLHTWLSDRINSALHQGGGIATSIMHAFEGLTQHPRYPIGNPAVLSCITLSQPAQVWSKKQESFLLTSNCHVYCMSLQLMGADAIGPHRATHAHHVYVASWKKMGFQLPIRDSEEDIHGGPRPF
jgi:hypothetical protein